MDAQHIIAPRPPQLISQAGAAPPLLLPAPAAAAPPAPPPQYTSLPSPTLSSKRSRDDSNQKYTSARATIFNNVSRSPFVFSCLFVPPVAAHNFSSVVEEEKNGKKTLFFVSSHPILLFILFIYLQ